MTSWQDFEKQCEVFLNERFGEYASFTLIGGPDSTKADVLTKTANGNEFYIEVKHTPAQCGQFVLIPDITVRCFKYSKLNSTPVNEYADSIINYMNADFESFKNAGTKGKSIEIANGSSIFAKWIISNYKNKGVKFLIVNDYAIFPLEELEKYFSISATYRVKRSGSADVGDKYADSVISLIKNPKFGCYNYRRENSKLFVSSKCELDKVCFYMGVNEYMFSLRGEEYEIRKLSNTFNANVIFSIRLKPGNNGLSDAEFISILK